MLCQSSYSCLRIVVAAMAAELVAVVDGIVVKQVFSPENADRGTWAIYRTHV